MNRLMMLACRQHRACRLRHRPRQPSRAPRRSPSPSRAGRRRSARAPSPRLAPSASTRPAWIPTRPAGQQFLPIRQRHLGQEHPDPRRQVQLRHVHQARRSVARAHARDLIEEAAKDPDSRIGAAYASFMDEAARRGEGPGAVPARGSSEIRGAALARPSYAALYAAAEPHRRRHARSAASSARTTSSPTNISCRMVQRPRHARPRLLSVERRQAGRDPGQISGPSDQHADAGRRDECRRPRQGDRRFRNQDRRGQLDPGRKPRRDQDLQQDDAAPSSPSARPGFDFARLSSRAASAQRRRADRRPAERDHRRSPRWSSKAPLGVLKDQLLVRSLDSYAAYLPAAFDKENFAFYGTTLSGTPRAGSALEARGRASPPARSPTTSASSTSRKYFPPETKAAADALVKNVIAAMGRRIDKLDWMAPETKVKAHAKLAAFTPKIGYPEPVAATMSALEIDRGDLLGNAMRVEPVRLCLQYRQARPADLPLGMGHDPDDDQRLCQFRHGRDRLPGRDPAAAVLRSQRRSGGQLWRHRRGHRPRDSAITSTTRAPNMTAKGRLVRLVDARPTSRRSTAASTRSASNMTPMSRFPGMHVKGKLTLGENVADLAGLTVAYDAYKHVARRRAGAGDRRHHRRPALLSRLGAGVAAQLSRGQSSPAAADRSALAVGAARRRSSATSTPGTTPIKVQPGQKLYLAPAERVRIW